MLAHLPSLFVPGLNIGVYQEAAEHLLSALSMHQTSSNADQSSSAPANSFLTKDEAINQSNNLWSSLRRAFYAMVRPLSSSLVHLLSACSFLGSTLLQDRPDLADKAVVGADLRQFAHEFDF